MGRFHATIFDFRQLQGEVEVLDIPPLTTVAEQVSASRTIPDVVRAIDLVTGIACTSLVNGIIVSPNQPLTHDADVVMFRVWTDGVPVSKWRPFQFGDLRPPVPPILDASTATPQVPPAAGHTGASSSRDAAIPHYASVTAFAPEQRYSYLDIFDGVQNRPKPAPGTEQDCINDILSSLPRRGLPISARAIVQQLPGLYMQQILVSRVLAQSGWHTIGIDLRP